MALTAFWNVAIERVAYRRLRGSFRLAPLISAIGMSIFLSNFVYVVQGPRNKSVPPVFDHVIRVTQGGVYDVTLSYKQILIVAVTAVLLAAFWYRRDEDVARPRAARVRAGHEDGGAARRRCRTARSPRPLRSGAALAAVAGVLYFIYYGVVNATDGFVPGVKAFTAAVLGGIGSLPGAVLGGLIIGLIETFWSAYFSADYKDVAAFSILAITLIFMPSGLLGRPDVEKV